MKKCNMCKLDLPLEKFNSNGSFLRAKCKDCYNRIKRERYIKHPRVLKYSSDEERKQIARERAKEWYKNNIEKAKERSKNHRNGITKNPRKKQLKYKSLREWNDARNIRMSKSKILNPTYWRYKKKRDKTIRRSRELNAGDLNISSIICLEKYNSSSVSSLKCEFCCKITGEDYHLEHLTPLSRGGKNNIENLAISCPGCNLEKLKKTVEEYKPHLLEYFKNRKLYD